MVFTLYMASLAVSIISGAMLSFFFWKHRYQTGAKAMLALMLATVVWSLGYIIQYTSDSLSTQILATDIEYIGIATLPVMWFIFSLQYSGHAKWLRLRNLFFLFIIPFATMVIVWTNGINGLMYYDRQLDTSGPITIITKSYGPWFWVAAAYNYLLILSGMAFLIRRLFHRPRLYRRQAIALLICVVAPLAWNAVYIFDLLPIFRIDWTPSAFIVSGLSIAWGLFHLRFLDIIPLARDIAIEGMSDGIMVLDTQNRIVDINPAALLIVDRSLEEVIGQPFTSILSEQSELVDRLNTTRVGVYLEIIIEKGETRYFYESSVSPIRDKQDRLIGRLVTLHDITERRLIEAKTRDLEEKAHETSRLSMVGEMAAGIAHEVSNPLTTVLGYSELLLRRDIPADVRDDLEVIDRSANRAADILERLLRFAGGQDTERDYIDINQIIETAVEFRRHSLSGKKIELNINLDGNLPMILGDGNQLQEVFLNLIINAENAMVQAQKGEGGTLSITTEAREDKIHISVGDTGIGIKEEHIKQIFNPFFTTMDPGEGTGLGLSISQRIVKGHGGEISVESQPGRGATFIIEFPVVMRK